MALHSLPTPMYDAGDVVMVSPATAAEMLKFNTHNRHARERAVKAYATDMRNGDWRWTGDPIRFGVDGTLLDGQHRLLAIIEADVTLPLLIVRGLDGAAQENIDGGVPRKFCDVLALRGEDCPVNLAAIVRLAYCWDNARTVAHTINGTNAAYLRTLEAHPELRRFASEHVRNKSRHAYLPGSLLGFLWWVFDAIDADDAEAFFERLTSETDHQKGDPIFELRRTLASNAESVRGERSRVWMAAITIKAWNAYRRGDTVALYRWKPGGAKPEKFPEPA